MHKNHNDHTYFPTLVSQIGNVQKTYAEGKKSAKYKCTYHLVNTYENRVGLLKELYFKSTSKNKAQNRNVFYYKILVTRTSAFMFLWPLHSRATLGFPALLAELLRCLWQAQSSCHAYLGRVALFSIAVHSLYLLHV